MAGDLAALTFVLFVGALIFMAWWMEDRDDWWI